MSLERFCNSTPYCRTSSGRRGSAILTRLLTFDRAMSTLVPTSKVAVMVRLPLEEAGVGTEKEQVFTPELFLDGTGHRLDRFRRRRRDRMALMITVGGVIWGTGRPAETAGP